MIIEKRVSDDPEPEAVRQLELMILERAVIESAIHWFNNTGFPTGTISPLRSAVDALLKVRDK